MPRKKRNTICRSKRKKITITARDQLWLSVALATVTVVMMSAISCSVTKYDIPESSDIESGREIFAVPQFASEGLELPNIDAPEFIISNKTGRYTICYDTAHRQAAWVAYVLTAEDVKEKGAERSDRFVIDATVKANGWPYAASTDYTNSGYDRGHLLPSADRNCGKEENKATFLMSNIAPQTAALNRGVWKSLEEDVRRFAARYDSLWIITGSALRPELPRIGKNGISIPEIFFKAVLAKNDTGYMSVAFVIPNCDTHEKDYWHYSVSVDSAEELLGYDFFCNLPESLQAEAEAQHDKRMWTK